MVAGIFQGEKVWDNTLRVLMRHSWQPKAFVGQLSVQASLRLPVATNQNDAKWWSSLSAALGTWPRPKSMQVGAHLLAECSTHSCG